MCIGIDELLRNRKPRLILPHLKVGIRRLGGDGDSSSNLVGLRSLEFISSRSFAAAQPSRKIDFPARRSSNSVFPLIAAVAWKTVRNRTKRIHKALNQLSAEVARPPLLLPLGLGGHVQTQRQDQDFGPGRGARQSQASGRRTPSTNFREAVVKIPASSHWPRRDYEMERDWWLASHNVDPRHNHLQKG